MKSYVYFMGILCLIFMTCCKKDRNKDNPLPPTIKPDPTLTLIAADIEDNDAVHIRGKIIAAAWLENPVYGIVYSADSIPGVNSPGKVILGNVTDSVDIAYTVKALLGGKNYTFRLFVMTPEKTWYSQSKQIVPPNFEIATLQDSFISRNTMITIYFTKTLSADEMKGFEVYVGDKKMDSADAVVEPFGRGINLIVPIDYKQGMPITIKKGLYSQTITPNIPLLPGYWRRIPAHEGAIVENAAYFTLGNKGYIVGGYPYGAQSVPVNTVWEIDLTTHEWKRKNPFPLTSLHSAVVVTVNSKAYLFGGVTGSSTHNDQVWEYDQVSDNWQSITSIANDIYDPGRLRFATAVYNNKIYLGTGVKLNGSNQYWYTKNWKIFDPAANTWETLPQLPSNNSIQSMTAYTYDNKLYLFGGDNGTQEVKENFVLNFSDHTWSKPDITRPVLPRTGVSIINKNNSTYFFGGYQVNPNSGRWMVRPEFWKMDGDQQYTQFASACTTELVDVLNRNAPIFPTANGFIVYNVFTWNGNNELTRSVIEYVAD
jgi:N-acetylneuraminic acid mutarotase